MSSKEEHFQLPSDYYRRVHPFITGLVIFFAWILFPVLVLQPTLLSPFVDDWMIKIAINNHSNLLKFLQIHIWVTFKYSSLFYKISDNFMASCKKRKTCHKTSKTLPISNNLRHKALYICFKTKSRLLKLEMQI